ncbi:MAG: hydroxymethylglutaryl-CoA lyase [Mycobacterium sp.]|jgi:hydroxymethylglutaryl-CoA lyase|nr:hydroxymethylglutaryl-CoA lyase [Mycobacterium sp.]
MTRPERVTITDVALRDGLQIQPLTVPTDTKLAIFDQLLAAGVRSLEVGSFVHPGLVPQMADADVLFQRLPADPDVQMLALVPNSRGAERALAAGVRDVRIVLSCTEGHSQANTNRSVAEGVRETQAVVDRLRAAGGVRVIGALATAFVCPFDGRVSAAQVGRLVGPLVDMGLDEISLADTLGKADPQQVEVTVQAMRERFPQIRFGLHLHNTYGMALANVVAGLDSGIAQFDAALGGIGGCPFAPGAAGNVATEDVVFMLHAMGVQTGIDMDALGIAAAGLRDALSRPLESAVSRALGWAA